MDLPVAPVIERPSISTTGLECMLNKVWGTLEEKQVRIAGIYGIGGVGKTRLLTKINKKIGVSSNRFDVVIWVTVSKGFFIEKVLDDITKRIDGDIDQENGSKLGFTTRVEVCGQMRAHKKIEVQCLPEEKAWKLFEEQVGDDILDSHPNIPELDRELAKECGGLPLVLITIGRAMACKKTPEEWEFATNVSKRSANFVFPDMGEKKITIFQKKFLYIAG
ncbi:hypothetical protein PTKIN_Ptkin18bG0045800 [Pterospermum kingtungense]